MHLFKILMLSEKNIILTTFVKNTNNAHIDDQASFSFKGQYIRP